MHGGSFQKCLIPPQQLGSSGYHWWVLPGGPTAQIEPQWAGRLGDVLGKERKALGLVTEAGLRSHCSWQRWARENG